MLVMDVVQPWSRIGMANLNPAGKAVLATRVNWPKDFPDIPSGAAVEVEDNPRGDFTVGYTLRELGVIVLEYTGDIEMLNFGDGAAQTIRVSLPDSAKRK